MDPSDKKIQAMKVLLEKQHNREFTWEEAGKAQRDLETFVEIISGIMMEQWRREKILEENPKGFHLDVEGYCCLLCGGSARGGNSWYDKFGLKCMACQNAIDRKIIPGSVVKNKDSWYSGFELDNYFGIKRPVLRRLVKQGLLKDRVIAGTERGIHLQLFLLKDNKGFLPPKKLLQSQMVTEIIDGRESYSFLPWFRFVNPHEYLKGYKIMDYLKVIYKDQREKKD
jgi:hypothetical protein